MEVALVAGCLVLLVLTYTLEPYILPAIFGQSWNTQKDLVVIRDAFDWKRIDNTTGDDEYDGSFEVVPGVTATEYIKRMKNETFVDEKTGESVTVRLPRPAEEFYECEFNNDEWVLPDKEVFQKMLEITTRQKRGEITEEQMDILLCRIIVNDLDKQNNRLVIRPNRKRVKEEEPAKTVMASDVLPSRRNNNSSGGNSPLC